MKRTDFRPNDSHASGLSDSDRQRINAHRVGNRHDTIQRFVSGQEGKTSNNSLHTDGNKLYSYDTIIATRNSDGSISVNKDKYSATTNAQQSALVKELSKSGIKTTTSVTTEKYDDSKSALAYGVYGESDLLLENNYGDYYNWDRKELDNKVKQVLSSMISNGYGNDMDRREIYRIKNSREERNKIAESFIANHEMKNLKPKQKEDFSTEVKDEQQAQKDYAKLEQQHPEHKTAIENIRKDEHTHEEKFKSLSRDDYIKSHPQSSFHPLSIGGMKEANTKAGYYFFSKDTMRMYRGAKNKPLYDRNTGTNYIKVEKPSSQGGTAYYRFNNETGNLTYVDKNDNDFLRGK